MNVSVRANVRTAQAATESLAGRPRHRLQVGRGDRHAGRRPRAARRRRLFLGPDRAAGLRALRPHRDRLAGRARLRRLADLDLRPSRRRHLHQGRRRRRRSRRQGRGRHSRGRSAQSRHDRRQCRRQCRRLRRHGGRPVRDLCGDRRRDHGARPRSSSPEPPIARRRDALSAGDLRRLHHHLDRRHVFRQARRQQFDHGRALQGPDRRPGLLSIVGLAIATQFVIGWGDDRHRRRQVGHRRQPVRLRHRRPRRHRPDRRHHRILHRHRQAPGGLDRAGLGHRPRHQRHPGPRGVAGVDRAAGPRHRRRHHRHLPARRPVRHGDRGDDHARPRRHDRRARRLRPGHRQCRRHRRNGGPAEGSAPVDRRARRGRQHHQGGDQGLCDRLGGPRRAGAVRGLFERPDLFRRATATSSPTSRTSARSRSTCRTLMSSRA